MLGFNISLKKIIQKTTEFYTCDKFFGIIIHTHIIALDMHYAKLNKIADFRI